ncbi:MAG TPA: 3-hydroxyacyl-[acyl-carrier-protein] dehydratase FabZ [Candidatus Nanoarchaeia archaeon]|nr:3-hydroxyacyl-[acyl-carrier-protein] dehydratase FabZ [Candidatus Nanoarchaeia archaeon]
MSYIDTLKDSNGHIQKDNIMKVIPYNDYFLFVDEVVSLEKNKIIAKKKISGKEDFLKGHFVGFPITPGALIVEGLGQAATFLARYNIPDQEKKDVLAYKLRDAKFMAPVLAGMEMTYEVESKGQMEKFAMMQGKVFVDGNLMAEAFMMLAIVDRDVFRQKHAPSSQ